jgi:methyl-accepting chemotaxis protein
VGELLTSGVRAVVDKALGRMASLRGFLRERIREVDRMAQREVMAAAQDVNTIYNSATTQIADLKSRLSTVTRGNGEAGVNSAERQLLAVERYVNDLEGRIGELKTIASQSAGCTAEIEQAAQQIQKLTTDAHMLSINARIEAARSTDGGSKGFAVIAVEMKEMSRAITGTSETVKNLARTLGALLPQLDKGMIGLREHSQEFSNSLAVDIRELASRSTEQKRSIEAAVAASDVTLGAIVKASQSALSHLQFQDVISQALMRMDAVAQETETAMCKDLDAEDRIPAIEAAMHVEIGGDKNVENENAGQVLLF